MNILEPLWVSVFTHNTFSCVKGRGIEGCARSVEKHIRKFRGKPLFILKIDIKKFYPSLPHKTLKEAVRWKIKDKRQIFPLARNRNDKHGRALDFVGYLFYREQKLIRKSIKKNFCRAAAKLYKKKPKPTPAEFKQTICSWLGWAQHSNSRNLLKTIIKPEYRNGIL